MLGNIISKLMFKFPVLQMLNAKVVAVVIAILLAGWLGVKNHYIEEGRKQCSAEMAEQLSERALEQIAEERRKAQKDRKIAEEATAERARLEGILDRLEDDTENDEELSDPTACLTADEWVRIVRED